MIPVVGRNHEGADYTGAFGEVKASPKANSRGKKAEIANGEPLIENRKSKGAGEALQAKLRFTIHDSRLLEAAARRAANPAAAAAHYDATACAATRRTAGTNRLFLALALLIFSLRVGLARRRSRDSSRALIRGSHDSLCARLDHSRGNGHA